MTVVQMGTITLPCGEEIVGLAIEATPEELRAKGNLLYQQVDIVPSDNSGNDRKESNGSTD